MERRPCIIDPSVDRIAAAIVDAAYHLHVGLGPGLLEAVYERVLACELTKRGLRVLRQQTIAFNFDGMHFEDGLRVDLIVSDEAGTVLVELKSVESLLPVHPKQVLTYLRLMNLPIGLLLNFGAPTMQAGTKRILNQRCTSVARSAVLSGSQAAGVHESSTA